MRLSAFGRGFAIVSRHFNLPKLTFLLLTNALSDPGAGLVDLATIRNGRDKNLREHSGEHARWLLGSSRGFRASKVTTT